MADWAAVGSGSRAGELVAKPLTPALLIAATLSLHVDDAVVRDLVLAGLALSLVGDVFLMLTIEGGFLYGLGAFFGAHLCYLVAFWVSGLSIGALAAGAAFVIVLMGTIGRRVVRGVARTEPELERPVAGYIVVISTMVAMAIGSENPVFIGGALLFYVSDLLIAWNRFLTPLRRGPVAIMVTYHLAQFGFVLGLLAV